MKFHHAPLHLIFLTAVLIQESTAQLIIFPPIAVSADNLSDAEEVSIVVNPLHPDQLAAGSNVNYFFYSPDKGSTWTGDGLSSIYGEQGDPSLVADSKGNIFYAHLSNPAGGYWLDRIVIQKSTDGGRSYSAGVYTGHRGSQRQQDKEWLSCDLSPTSPYRDNVYMPWTEFDSYKSPFPKTDSSRILFSRSTDGGDSWSDPIVPSDRDGDCSDSSNTDEGATCATGPNGELYLTWSSHDGLLFDKSIDGGKTFGKDKIIQSLTPGWDFDVSGIYRCNGFATTLCDISHRSTRGNIYTFFSDKRNGVKNSDVFMLRSTNAGATWALALRVNDDTTKFEQFFPSATIDQSTGYLYCVFYDRRNTNGGDLTDVYLARSIDGGNSFQNFRLTTNPFLPVASTFFGDYIHIAALNGYIYPIWMQCKTIAKATTTNIWTTRILDTAALNDVHPTPDRNGRTLGLILSPNPVSTTLHLRATVSGENVTRVDICDLLGRKLKTVYDGIKSNEEFVFSIDANQLKNGIYYCILQSGVDRIVSKFVVSH